MKIYKFTFWEINFSNQFKNSNFKIWDFSLKGSIQSYKKSQISSPNMGIMGYFKVDQNSWPGVWKTNFLWCVLNYVPCGVGFILRWGFCVLGNGTFWESLIIQFFEGSTFNLFWEFYFQSLRSWIKNDLLKVPKITKSNKFMFSPKTGSYGRF